jgi:hypothetical protein
MQYDDHGHLLAVYGPRTGKPVPVPGDPDYLRDAAVQVRTHQGHSPLASGGPVKVNRGSW